LIVVRNLFEKTPAFKGGRCRYGIPPRSLIILANSTVRSRHFAAVGASPPVDEIVVPSVTGSEQLPGAAPAGCAQTAIPAANTVKNAKLDLIRSIDPFFLSPLRSDTQNTIPAGVTLMDPNWLTFAERQDSDFSELRCFGHHMNDGSGSNG
jgi:hypothetical protein